MEPICFFLSNYRVIFLDIKLSVGIKIKILEWHHYVEHVLFKGNA